MSNMDVSLRLRLINDLSKEADRAERDLKDLEATARKLGRTGGSNRLGRDVAAIGSEADKAQKKLHQVNQTANKLGQVGGVGKLEKDMNQIGRAADRSEQKIREVETAARRLGTVNTDKAEAELKQLGAAGQKARGDVAALNREMNKGRGAYGKKFSDIDQPAGALNGTLLALKGSAGAAFGGLLAFASVDNIIRGLEQLGDQYRKLNREVASVAVTAEMRTPEAIERISKSNEQLSVRYGFDQREVNDARKTYAAAGFDLDQQEAILDPTLKAAKTADTTGETLAKAIVALQQNLGIKNEEVPLALDMMSKGSKLGKFEVDAMARNFPKLATMYAGTGRSGLDATAELVALAQIVQRGAGSEDIAANNLDNIIGKLSSPDTVKNFAEMKVDLPKLRARSEKRGTPYMLDVVDEVMRLTGGDEFKIGELFGDKEAKLALAPLIDFRQDYEAFLAVIKGSASGTVDEDRDFTENLPQEKADRRAAAFQAAGDNIGEWYDYLLQPLKERAARLAYPEYGRQEDASAERRRLRELDLEDLRSQIADREKQLAGMPRPKFGDTDILSGARMTVEQELQRLRGLLQSGEKAQPTPADRDLGKRSGKDFIPVPTADPRRQRLGKVVPIPTAKPLDRALGADMSGAADSAMDGYNERLKAAADRAISTARDAAAQMMQSLNFTATPTIQPNFVPGGGTGTSVKGEKHSSVQQSTGVKVTQHITSPNSKMAANRSVREQNRAIRQAQARSLSGTGRSLA